MVAIYSRKPSTLMELESPKHKQEHRSYLGMSQLGHDCERYLWYSFRWAYTEEITDRLHRLFQRGHREEPHMVAALEAIGIECHSFQAEFVAGWGHIKGHCDGLADKVPEAPKSTHLLEFKTMNDKSFKKTQKVGVKEAHPIYYGQCQIGMKFYGVKRTLFLSVNKNDDSYYVERLRYDPDVARMLVKRGERIILSPEPPEKQFKPTWWKCKFCSARDTCHFGVPMETSCRTCKHVEVGKDGQWLCRGEAVLSIQDQQNACPDYTLIETE